VGAGPDPAPRAEPEPLRLLAVVTVVAAVVVVLVGVALLRAGSPDGREQATPPPGEPVKLETASIRASSTLEAAGATSYDAANMLDGDPETAWNEGRRGDGTGEWVEITLAGAATVQRLQIWNGHQKEDLFAHNGRVRMLLIDAGERTFLVELLDVAGPQVVELAEPVRTTTVRLTVDSVYPGERYPELAISEVELYGH
jgi:hypothetical protein